MNLQARLCLCHCRSHCKIQCRWKFNAQLLQLRLFYFFNIVFFVPKRRLERERELKLHIIEWSIQTVQRARLTGYEVDVSLQSFSDFLSARRVPVGTVRGP